MDQVTLMLDASGMVDVGVQAEMGGQCSKNQATALPHAAAVSLTVRGPRSGPDNGSVCKLRLRLCANQNSAIYKPGDPANCQ